MLNKILTGSVSVMLNVNDSNTGICPFKKIISLLFFVLNINGNHV